MTDYKPMPLTQFPNSVGRFIRETAASMQCDPAFVALPALSTLAAAIGTTRMIQLKPGWVEPAIVWTCIIARSGTLKSPAWEAAVKPLADAEHRAQLSNQEASAEYETAKLYYEKELAKWKRDKVGTNCPPQKPEPPPRVRHVVGDVTLEALAPILAENPRGVLVARDELAGWVRGFDQYKASGRGGDAAAWLELHRAGRVSVDRKTDRRTIYLPRAAASVCGTIQPSIFAAVMRGEHFESGLAARILVAQPPERCKRFTAEGPSRSGVEGYAETIGRLLQLNHVRREHGLEPARLKLSPDARRFWKEWYDRHAVRQYEAADDAEAAALAKLEAYAARFALVFQLVHDPNAVEINADCIAPGCSLADWFADEAERVYLRLADDDETAELRRLVEWITRKGGEVTARELARALRAYPTVADAESALDRLVGADVGTWTYAAGGHTGRRPSRVFRLFGTNKGTSAPSPADAPTADETPPGDAESGVLSASALSARPGDDGEWGEV